MIICHLPAANLKNFSLAEFGCGARSFAGDCEGFWVGGAWHGRVVSGGRVAPERPVLKSYAKTDSAVKIRNETATTLAY